MPASPVEIAVLAIFALAYLFVLTKEWTGVAKSKPVLLASALIWTLIALNAELIGTAPERIRAFLDEELLQYAELFLFLLVSTTYVNVLSEQGLFARLAYRLSHLGLSYRQIFWLVGLVTFLLSTVVNNLTTALVAGTVILTVGERAPRFVTLSCISACVASNAGGAFSPFGDITTLMVWQAGKLHFAEFFKLFPAALASWLLPALCLHFALPKGAPELGSERAPKLQAGTRGVLLLFGLTLLLAAAAEQFLRLPPSLGMMAGLSLLLLYEPRLKRGRRPFDIFRQIQDMEWDTLLFFYGVVLSVGGLGYLGYLDLLARWLYLDLGATWANLLIGLISAVVDNVPVMYAVLEMSPPMDKGQWLLVTLTAGVGGSLLAIGSAAGVALLGLARGFYTSLRHLVWAPAIALGYAASAALWLYLSGSL